MDTLRYRDNVFEVAQFNDVAVLHDRRDNTYHEGPVSELPDSVRKLLSPDAPKVSQSHVLSIAAYIAFATFIGIYLGIYREIPGNYDWLAIGMIVPVYSILHLILHEYSHIAALRYFGRRHDKIGFKLHLLILPAVYVRMNQTVLLHKYERFAVHSAGLVSNHTLNILVAAINVTAVKSSGLGLATEFVFLTSMFNTIPLLNSDGYRMILAVLGRNVRKGVRSNLLYINVYRAASLSFSIWYLAYGIIS